MAWIPPLFGSRFEPSIFGIALGVVGFAGFAYRFKRRRQYLNERWSSFANWGVYAVAPVFGMVLFGGYTLGLVIEILRRQ